MNDNNLKLRQLLWYMTNRSYDDSEFETFFNSNNYDLNYQISRDISVVKCKPEWLGYTILHFAVEQRRHNWIELLLFRSADITLKAGNSFTPLRLAVEKIKNAESTTLSAATCDRMIELLLSAHIESNNPTNPSCKNGISHFHIACLANKVPVAKFFLENGISANQSINVTSDFFPGWTPLHFAVKRGSEDLIKLLLTYNADINHVDGNGLTPLRLLVERCIELKNCVFLGMFKYSINEIKNECTRNDSLIHLFINKDSIENVVDNIGLSFFHVSCAMIDTTLAQIFLKLGADINSAINIDSPKWPGYTPAHFAACCNLDIFKLLLINGANILAKDAKGITPFDLFIQRYEPVEVCDVLNLHPTLRSIEFENGVKLVNLISNMNERMENFVRFCFGVDVNTRLPANSPLWPGYTIAHLAVALGKKKYGFCKVRNFYSNDNHDFSEVDETFLRNFLSCFKPNLTIKGADGMTPLFLAFCSHKENMVNLILNKVAWRPRDYLRNFVDPDGFSHFLQVACITNKVELVRKFLVDGLDPNRPTQSDLTWYNSSGVLKSYRTGSTLYHIAATNDSFEMIEAISGHGCAKANLLDADGLTAVHVGFLNNCSPSTLRKLLSFRENQEINYTAVSAGKLSHLHVACYDFNYSVVNIVEKLVSLNVVDVNAPIDFKVDNRSLYADQLACYAGWTPLHFAISYPFDKPIDWLISKGADVCKRNADGLNPMHLALQKWPYMVDLIKLLYGELKTKGDWPDDFGLTKLHIACFLENNEEIKSLLRTEEYKQTNINRQINANSPIWPGDTALHISIRSPEITNLLLDHGADLTFKNSAGFTPLHLLGKEMTDVQFIIQAIEKAGPHFYESNPTDKDGLSHFHISCMIGNVEIVKKFIDFVVNVNESVCPFASKYAGDTPLHFAVRHDNREVVELLLQHGANWKLENSMGCRTIQEVAHSTSKSAMLTVFFKNAQIDLQSQNVHGETVLGMLMASDYISVFQNLLEDETMRINFVDPPAKKEDIARAAWELDNEVFRTLVERATDLANIDVGKNILHRIASFNYRKEGYQKIVRCAFNVKMWLDKGCDLNLQDKLGRTPLHYAVATGGQTVKVLLLLGANVNIRDNQGLTAFAFLNNVDNVTRRFLVHHILMMTCSGLDLDASLNEIARRECYESSRTRLNIELEMMKNISIAEDLSMRDLLTEKLVRNFRHFSVSKREAILEFFRLERLIEDNRFEKYWIPILQFQYQKILRRSQLLEVAVMSFDENICKLHCKEHVPPEIKLLILDYLSNDDLESLIKVEKKN